VSGLTYERAAELFTYDPSTGKAGDKVLHLGTFATPEEAHAKYLEAKAILSPGRVPESVCAITQIFVSECLGFI